MMTAISLNHKLNADVAAPLFDRLSADRRAWVEHHLRRLTFEGAVRQLFQPVVIDSNHPGDPQKRVEAAAQDQVGSIYFADASSQLMQELVELAKSEMEIPPLIATHSELGAVSILEGSRFGNAMNLGSIPDFALAEKLAFECGGIAARENRTVGINWAYGPVFDIPFNPLNNRTNVNAFAADPERIAALACAYARGLQAGGVAATMMHFPGDGMDARDQQVTTPVNSLDKEAWLETYGKTFGAGMVGDVWALMAGHIALPSVGGRNPRNGLPLPATLDPAVTREFLREQLGYRGLVVSNALSMGGIAGHCRDRVDATVRCMQAGCDVALSTCEHERTVEAVKTAIGDGRLTEEEIYASVRRVLSLKAQLGVADAAEGTGEKVPAGATGESRAIEVGKIITEQSVTLLRNLDDVYPLSLQPGATILVCELPNEYEDSSAAPPLGEAVSAHERGRIATLLEARGFEVIVVRDFVGFEKNRDCADAVIYVFQTVPGQSMGHLRLSKSAIYCLKWDVLKGSLPSVCVSLGNPHVLWELVALPNLACTFSPDDSAQEAFVKALFGEIPFAGKCSVDVDGAIKSKDREK